MPETRTGAEQPYEARYTTWTLTLPVIVSTTPPMREFLTTPEDVGKWASRAFRRYLDEGGAERFAETNCEQPTKEGSDMIASYGYIVRDEDETIDLVELLKQHLLDREDAEAKAERRAKSDGKPIRMHRIEIEHSLDGKSITARIVSTEEMRIVPQITQIKE